MKDLFKSWTTRKKTLVFAIAMVMLYVVSDVILTIVYANTGSAIYFDSTLTTEFFEFMKLISGLGGGLTAAEMLAETVQVIVTKKPVQKKKKVSK